MAPAEAVDPAQYKVNKGEEVKDDALGKESISSSGISSSDASLLGKDEDEVFFRSGGMRRRKLSVLSCVMSQRVDCYKTETQYQRT